MQEPSGVRTVSEPTQPARDSQSRDRVDDEHDEAGRSGRVLVVDDDPAVGRVFARVLKPMNVTFSQSAAGALGRIGGGGHFAAIVCDLHMPGIDGVQFFEEVAKIDVHLAQRIVFVTGMAGEARFESLIQRAGCTCLQKPVDSEELRRVVGAIATTAPTNEQG
jgi:CheY-like chemotaxis protein